MSERFRFFYMGNALVVGLVERMGKMLGQILENEGVCYKTILGTTPMCISKGVNKETVLQEFKFHGLRYYYFGYYKARIRFYDEQINICSITSVAVNFSNRSNSKCLVLF